MTQEGKELLLKDLCARLPYGVHVHFCNTNIDEKLTEISLGETINQIRHNGKGNQGAIKPYLRPMSSITEEENKTIDNISNKGKGFEEDEDGWIRCDSIHTKWGVWPDGCAKLLDYLNSIHIDYRGLIPMGLALEAPEDMYNNIKEK